MGPELFDFALPRARIAQRPARRRGDARLMVVGPPHGHTRVDRLSHHLAPDALLVVNDSRVLPARLHLQRADGRTFELLICDPQPQLGPGSVITAWVRGARRLRTDDCLRHDELVLRALGPATDDPRGREFMVEAGQVDAVLRVAGELPLPPYIERPDGPTPDDRLRYQTTYARYDGSVAAPTAGLHLEPEALATMDVVHVTLHVGPGTFLPIEVDDVRNHRVRGERYRLSPEAASRLTRARQEGRPIVAVGTTVVRLLESVCSPGAGFLAGEGRTDLVVTPGHRFVAVDAMLTNFHLPRSSLLMLVCTFGGRERVLDAYREAVAQEYRFYSYGDCMLLSRGQP